MNPRHPGLYASGKHVDYDYYERYTVDTTKQFAPYQVVYESRTGHNRQSHSVRHEGVDQCLATWTQKLYDKKKFNAVSFAHSYLKPVRDCNFGPNNNWCLFPFQSEAKRPNMAECQEICQRMKQCEYFEYLKDVQFCYLISSIGTNRIKSAVLGPKYCASDWKQRAKERIEAKIDRMTAPKPVPSPSAKPFEFYFGDEDMPFF